MSEIKLLPCPFCGGEAEIYVTKHIPNGYDYTPRCKNTGCCGRLSKKFTSKDVSIVFWNKRKPMERIIERLEEAHTEWSNVFNFDYDRGVNNRSAMGMCAGVLEAIDIVKEEGGIE